MNVSQLLRGLTGELRAAEPKALELKAGQVVRGTVIKQLPDQEAIVSINGVTVKAKLEAPLKQGEATWLQVQGEQREGQVVLKPVQAGQGGSVLSEEQLVRLLKESGVKDGLAERRWLMNMQQAGIPLTKENVKALVDAMRALPAKLGEQEWLQSAIITQQRGLSLTISTIGAMREVLFGPPLHHNLSQLTEQLTHLSQSTAGLQAQGAANGGAGKLLSQLIQQLAVVMRDASANIGGSGPLHTTNTLHGASQSILHGMSSQQATSMSTVSQSPIVGQAANGAMSNAQSALSANAAGSGTALSQSAAWSAQSFSQQTAANRGNATTSAVNAANISSATPTISITVPGHEGASPLTAGPHISSDGSAAKQSPSQANMHASSQPSAAVVEGDRPSTANAAAGGIATHSAETNAQSLSGGHVHGQNAAAVSGMTGEATMAVVVPEKTAAVASAGPMQANAGEQSAWIGRLLRAMGVEHEADFNRVLSGNSNDRDGSAAGLSMHLQRHGSEHELARTSAMDTLKSLLMKVEGLEQLPLPVRESAQQLILQITGQQLLLSVDRSSAFNHLMLMIPLQLPNGQQTAAIHIQSRKGANGAIEAENCRLLFELDMTHLGMLLADVHIVDRMVAVHVHNDHPITKHIFETKRMELSDALSRLGFQMSSLKCSAYPVTEASTEHNSPLEDAQREATIAQTLRSMYKSPAYKGVDLRI